MNTTIEILENQKNELYKQIHSIKESHQTYLSSKAHSIVDQLDELFKEFIIEIDSTRISFKTNGFWNDFEINRRSNYSINEEKYTEASLSMSSSSDVDEVGLKRFVCAGVLAKYCLNKTDEWKQLITLMDEHNELHKKDISPLNSQTWDIENSIRKLRDDEYTNKRTKILNAGKLKVQKSIEFYYGNGKWDFVRSNVFEWEQNESGKTYKVFYYDETRTNPHYDEDGNRLEPIMEKRKREVNKRIRVADLQSFISNNMHHSAE